jgi:predicted alpha/beta hydrolase family esterase
LKNAILLHGTGGRPDSYWFPSIRNFLAEKSYEVWAPQLPSTDDSDLSTQLPFVLKNGIFTEATIMIGHSAGCPLILSVLEKIRTRIRLAIFVAGFSTPLEKAKGLKILQPAYDFGLIRKRCGRFIIINSKNDPWGCDHKKGKEISDKVHGELLIQKDQGHFGSDYFKQPYPTFPLLKAILDQHTSGTQ